jgi:signal transduction histidine kinase
MDEEGILNESELAEQEKAKRAAELVIANEEKAKREAELVIANVEKAKQTAGIAIAEEEKAKRVAELVIAEEEKAKRVAELVIANEEKAKRVAELIIDNEEKSKRVAELVIAEEEKAKRVAELVIANEEKAKRVAELVFTNNELQQSLQLNADKDLFLSILAHDLRSPFTALLGITDLLIENIRVHNIDETEVLLNHLKDASMDTFALLEDLLKWTSTQSGKIPFNPQILDFSDICTNILETLNKNADAKNITVKSSTNDNISVFADIDMLKTVLRNLVSNAIKFTNKGGTIIINAEENSENVTISVSDNGIGIMPDKLTNLFDISHRQTTRGTEKESGTGLGLILCKEFVEKNAGKIWAESEAGKGSNFKFTLPIHLEKTP